MKNRVKKVAAIHDISGVGRAALTSIIPILSFTGIQVCPLPTAVLSSQTAHYDDFTFVDLTDSMEDYIDHWKKLNIDFDYYRGEGVLLEKVLPVLRLPFTNITYQEI